MRLIFKIKVYHGTDNKNVFGILKKGFDLNTVSCATQNKKFASGYGNVLLSFKYPFLLNFSIRTIRADLEYFYFFILNYKNKSLPTCVSGFKPKKLKIELTE